MNTFSSLNESSLEDCFFSDECPVMLFLLPLDGTDDMPELVILSAEFLGPSEIGDLMDSLEGFVIGEALAGRELQFEFINDDDSSMFCDFNSLLVLQICVQVL